MVNATLEDATLEDVRAKTRVERLLEESWSARSRHASRRELVAESVAAAAFLAVAVTLAFASRAGGHVDLGLAALLVVALAFVARAVRFPSRRAPIRSPGSATAAGCPNGLTSSSARRPRRHRCC
jgi:hypothetical protein